MKCLWCGKTLKHIPLKGTTLDGSKITKRKNFKKFCNRNCSSQHWSRKMRWFSEEYRTKKKIYFKKWYENNKEKINEKMKQYYHKNKVRCDIRNLTHTHKKEIFKKLGKKCSRCNSEEHLEIHHTTYDKEKLYPIDKTKRGKRTKFNYKYLIILCRDCHRYIHSDKFKMEEKNGENKNRK